MPRNESRREIEDSVKIQENMTILAICATQIDIDFSYLSVCVCVCVCVFVYTSSCVLRWKSSAFLCSGYHSGFVFN